MSKGSLKDYYRTLGVGHLATALQIEQAYEELVRKCQKLFLTDPKVAENQLNDISEAFEVLYNRRSRAHYDEVFRKGYSLHDAESTFSRFFAENDCVNEQERQLLKQTAPKPIKDYYAVLGLPKTASLQEIKQAYRAEALKYHPRNNSDPAAEQRFLDINEAYEVLSSEPRRQAHESLLFGNFDSKRTHSIFEDFFGVDSSEFSRASSESDFFFEPKLKKRWSRNLDRLMDDDFDFSAIADGETFKESTVYTRENGLETRKNVKTRVRVKKGETEETKLEEYLFPNGERDVVRTVTTRGGVDRKTYHLKQGEELPKELAL